ncbi:helix-turn-helix domain-containing protein [Enterocloster lavalensis]|uniref:helix-turn-helix domain-containing protein n=1 Tax=Enterocloster lavalensis TaxID=460384 RepID=UPI00266570D2|nr:helix-turn-helix domain-containing protein [Enterocloster lavalensis]
MEKTECMVYSVVQAAEVLGVSKSFMYKLARNKAIPVIRLGKRLVIPKNKFHEFINNQ